MKTMLNLLSVSFLFLAGVTYAGEKCDCTAIAGLWTHVDQEAHIGTFVNIPAGCEGVRMQQIPEQKENTGLTTDRILCLDGKYRMQYRYPKGYIDDEGHRAVYPLPKIVAEALRGDVRVSEGGKLSFGIDFIDQLCIKRDGKPCESASFDKIPESEILRD